jgi:hypothetical protein
VPKLRLGVVLEREGLALELRLGVLLEREGLELKLRLGVLVLPALECELLLLLPPKPERLGVELVRASRLGVVVRVPLLSMRLLLGALF